MIAKLRRLRVGSNRLRRVVFGTSATLMLGMAGVAVDEPAAHAEVRENLGPLDFGAYCDRTYSEWITATYGTADLFGPDVYSWRCVVHQWNGQVSGVWLGWALLGIHEIDVHHACRTMYEREDATAGFTNEADPHSWFCYVVHLNAETA